MHELIHADCLDVVRNMRDRSVDCIVTDPPYIIGAKGCGLVGDRQYPHDIHDAGIDKGFDPVLLKEFVRITRLPNIIVFSSRLQIRDYLDWAHENEFNGASICWHKPNPTPLGYSKREHG